MYDSLLELSPKKYHFIKDETKKTHYGILAQEVETFCSELVMNIKDDSGIEYKGVNYLEFIPILIGKMKKMQEEINDLRERLDYRKI